MVPSLSDMPRELKIIFVTEKLLTHDRIKVNE